MIVATYNAASVRARLPLLVEWLAENEPDVLVLQETKVEDDKFPRGDFEDLGYEIALHGQKAWNGVAILSRLPISKVETGFPDPLMPVDARLISAEIEGVRIINTYVPNGNTVGSEKWEYKMRWLEKFREYLFTQYRPTDPLLWLGDINIAPTPDDVYDSKRMLGGVGHHPDEFSRLEKIVEFGLVDVFRKYTEGPGHYTFWDFTLPRGVEKNLGWRIDHIYATEPMVARCQSCRIDKAARILPKPSDHTFVIGDFYG